MTENSHREISIHIVGESSEQYEYQYPTQVQISEMLCMVNIVVRI